MADEAGFTPGPWISVVDRDGDDEIITIHPAMREGQIALVTGENKSADGYLITAAPDLYEALLAVNKLISEAAMTGFNYADGDWAERLFFSQQATSRALAKCSPQARVEGSST